MASLKPTNPSTEAISISFTPLFFNSLRTSNQYFDDYDAPINIPRTSFFTSRFTPIAA